MCLHGVNEWWGTLPSTGLAWVLNFFSQHCVNTELFYNTKDKPFLCKQPKSLSILMISVQSTCLVTGCWKLKSLMKGSEHLPPPTDTSLSFLVFCKQLDWISTALRNHFPWFLWPLTFPLTPLRQTVYDDYFLHVQTFCPETREIQFNLIYDKEKHQILTRDTATK